MTITPTPRTAQMAAKTRLPFFIRFLPLNHQNSRPGSGSLSPLPGRSVPMALWIRILADLQAQILHQAGVQFQLLTDHGVKGVAVHDLDHVVGVGHELLEGVGVGGLREDAVQLVHHIVGGASGDAQAALNTLFQNIFK